jgi:iron complex outermembrane recepter protein
MNEHRGRNALTVAGAVALALAAAAAGAETATPLGEVFVTAQKRAESLADIPMSVSVLPGEALERQQVQDFKDLVSLVPGLSINTTTAGITRLTMRGINTGGVATTVGVYVNDVPFGSSSGLANGAILSGDFDTFDMNRIEVLRGPQGTLYGASSLGGVIKYVTNEPSTDGFEGRARATVEDVEGGGTGYAFTGVVNIPMSETFAIRASGFYRSDEGFVDSIGNNPLPFILDPGVIIEDGTRVDEDFNSVETSGGRLSALLQPSEDFSLTLTALFQDIDSEGSNLFEADPVTLEPLYGGFVASRYHPEYTDVEYRVYSATLDWDFGAVSLQSVTSYSEFSDTFQRDATLVPLGGLPVAQLATLVYGAPLGALLNQVTSTDKFTQELRLVSPESDAFEWLVGAYYTDEDSGIDPQTYTLVDPGTETPAAGIPALAEGGLVSTYEEIALFANATWHLTERFDLSFGGRWSDNDQEATQVLTIGLPPELGGGTAVFDGLTSSESPFTWSVSPRYEFSDTTSVYARVATGFRPGGPNVLPPGSPPELATYDADELTSYEIGLRAGNSDGTFALDVAAYFLDWDDIQLFASIGGVGVNANGGTAESKGLELTATARSGGFTATFTGAYIDAELTEDTDPVVGGLDGDSLPWVPEWTLGVGADYEWNVFGDGTAYVGGQVSYTGDQTTDFSIRDAGGSIVTADNYTTLDLRTGIVNGKWSIELYGKNVTDEEGLTDINTTLVYPNGAYGVGVIRPRTIGLAVGVRF